MDRKENLKAISAKGSSNAKQSTQSINNNSGAATVNNGKDPAVSTGNFLPGQYGTLSNNNHISPGSSVRSVGGTFANKNPQKPNSFRSTNSANPSTLFTSPVKSINLPRKPITSNAKSVIGITANRSFRANVERAIREHKVYSVVGVYPAVRNALKKRGWVEKISSTNARPSVPANNLHSESKVEDETDIAWVSRILRDYTPDFVWVIRRDGIDWKMMNKEQIVNRFPKAFFTTKVGLAACMQNLHWFSEAGIADTFFPRCYRLCLEEEKQAFVDDYRMSACLGYLKWLVQTYEEEGEKGVSDPASKITILSVDFAVRQVNNYIRMRRHEDIDWLLSPAFMAQHWDVFLSQYTTVVQKGASKLRADSIVDAAKSKYEAAKRALQRVAPYWPQLHVDGIKNIWICKPGARSRGKGIVVMNSLEKIMELLSHNNFRDTNWVVQKYIERPMLIYKTKFDIRQWFIITDWSPLTVWFYKESYVRFCTKPFSLEDFHESVHLCNNAVQCRYQNSELRDSQLPDENMWDCYTFQAHLKTLGKMDEWKNVYHGMKQSIMGVLLASQETVEPRKGCFELYGADFMLSEDLRPWLIEINSCPCMAASTSVTARMCAQCLEDTIKVVLDRKDDKNADTGMFELIFKQNMIPMTQQFTGHDLIISGTKLSRDIDWPSIMTKFGNRKSSISSGSAARIQKAAPHRTDFENGFTFNDLIHRLKVNDGVSTSYNSALLSTVHGNNTRGRSNFNSPIRQEKSIEPGSIVTVRKIQTIMNDAVDTAITGQPSKFVPGFSVVPSTNTGALTNRAQSIIANSNNNTSTAPAPTRTSKISISNGPTVQAPTMNSNKKLTPAHPVSTKRSKALYSDMAQKYTANVLKNGNVLNTLMRNSGVANALLADMVRGHDSNMSVLKKIANVNRVKSPYLSQTTTNTNNNKSTPGKQRSRPSTSGGKFDGAKSVPNTAVNKTKDENSLPSVEKEKYGKLRAMTHSNDSLNLINVITDLTDNFSGEIDEKDTSESSYIFNDNNVLGNSDMFEFHISPSDNSSTSNQVSVSLYSEESSLPAIVRDIVPARSSKSSPENISSPPNILTNLNNNLGENPDDGPNQTENEGSQMTGITTAYSQLYMLFPATPVHTFLESGEDNAENSEASDSAEEKNHNEKEKLGIDTDAKTHILEFKEPRVEPVELVSQTDLNLIDLHTTIDPEETETDSKTTITGNDSNTINNLSANESLPQCASQSLFENSQKADSSKRKKKKYRDFCSNCFSILCRCKGAAALESPTYQNPTEGKVATNNDPIPTKFPCYRIFLEQRTPVALSKRSAATLPLKTINLNLS